LQAALAALYRAQRASVAARIRAIRRRKIRLDLPDDLVFAAPPFFLNLDQRNFWAARIRAIPAAKSSASGDRRAIDAATAGGAFFADGQQHSNRLFDFADF